MLVASHRSVGVARGVLRNHRPCTAGAPRFIRSVRTTPKGSHSTPNDPSGEPRADVRGPTTRRASTLRRPYEVAVHGGDSGVQLGAECRGHGRVVEPARLRRIRLVGEVDTLEEVERGVRMRAVVACELVVERRGVGRVDPYCPDPELPYLREPAPAVRLLIASSPGWCPRSRRAEVDAREEPDVAVARMQRIASAARAREHREAVHLSGRGRPRGGGGAARSRCPYQPERGGAARTAAIMSCRRRGVGIEGSEPSRR
jgi:hypothetical protein